MILNLIKSKLLWQNNYYNIFNFAVAFCLSFSIASYGSCQYLPYQRAEAEQYIDQGERTLHAAQHNLVLYTVNQYKDPSNTNKVSSYIWLVDKKKCRRLIVFPLPENAVTNTRAVVDGKSIPIRYLKNGLIEISYAFTTLDDPKKLFIHKVKFNHKFFIVEIKKISIPLSIEANTLANTANWQDNGELLLFSYMKENLKHQNYVVAFNEEQAKLYQFELEHPEANLTKDHIIYDMFIYDPITHLPTAALLLSFDFNMNYFRQFYVKKDSDVDNNLNYLIPHFINDDLVFQFGRKIFNARGQLLAIVPLDENINSDTITSFINTRNHDDRLTDYIEKDAFEPSDIKYSIWQNDKWEAISYDLPKRKFLAQEDFEEFK